VTVRETPEQISEIIDEFTDGDFVRYRPAATFSLIEKEESK
jgi:hypothetical protein